MSAEATRRSLLQRTGAAAIAFSLAGCGEPRQPVAVYSRNTHFGPTALDDVRRATGVPVTPSLFATSAELMERMRAGNPGFDVIVPSDEVLSHLIAMELVQPLDRELLTNAGNVAPEFQVAPFDPGRLFSVAYTWSMLGIVYRKAAMPEGVVPNSWRFVLENAELGQRIILPAYPAELVRIAARYKGHSLNGIPDELLAEIETMLARQKPNVADFISRNAPARLASGVADIVVGSSFEAARLLARPDGAEFGWVVPEEGTLRTQDCFAVPAGAPNVAEAHAFINAMLDPAVAAVSARDTGAATANAAALRVLTQTEASNPVLYPPPDVLARAEYAQIESDAQSERYEAMFERLRAA